MESSRRVFLQALAASTAVAMVAGRSGAVANPVPKLTTWTPPGGWGTFGKPRRILEIYLRGGASLWGTFLYNTNAGGAAGTGDATFNTSTIVPAPAPVTHAWHGGTIGEAADPLFRQNGIVAGRALAKFMRVLRVRHDLPPHEAAIPYAATGSTLGRPQMSGLGAAVYRRHIEAIAGVPVPGPRSLIFQTGNQTGDDNASRYLATYGLHGAQYRPPVIKVGDQAFYNALDRLTDKKTITDDVKRLFRGRYADRMSAPTSVGTTEVRSLGWSSYKASLDTMVNDYAILYSLLTSQSGLLFPPAGDPALIAPTLDTSNLTRYSITAALNLLVAHSNQLQHVAVVDGGVFDNYDTHDLKGGIPAAQQHAGNLWNVCDTLADNMDAILDNGICVLIHSEFGRIGSGVLNGTGHYTDAYANIIISDLVTPGFSGDVDSTSFAPVATYPGAHNVLAALSPTDTHAAVAQLAGIQPWQSDMFGADADLSALNDASVPNPTVLTLANSPWQQILT